MGFFPVAEAYFIEIGRFCGFLSLCNGLLLVAGFAMGFLLVAGARKSTKTSLFH